MGGAWHFRALLVWVVLMGLAYWGFDRYLAPQPVRVTASAAGLVEVPRARDGHYYLPGSINGQALTFMVDTGASSVVVSAEFARRAGLPKGYPQRFGTANGSLDGEMVPGQTVEAGGLTVGNIQVGVGLRMDSPELALLGQSFLRQVEVLQAGDRLQLRLRPQ